LLFTNSACTAASRLREAAEAIAAGLTPEVDLKELTSAAAAELAAVAAENEEAAADSDSEDARASA
jgi:hypothetical protein